MKRFAAKSGVLLAVLVALAALASTPALAADSEFDAVVSSIEQRYQVRHEHVPLMRFVSFCASVYTRGGVRGIRIANFEDVGPRMTADDVDVIVREKLGASWHTILRSHDKEAKDDTIIYARPRGSKFLLLIAEVEDGQLSLVKLGIHGKALSQWVNDQKRHSKK